MCSIIPASELISIFISHQFTMFSSNIGIFRSLRKHNTRQHFKRCSRQQKSSRSIINDDSDCFCVSSEAPYCIYISAFFITTAVTFFNCTLPFFWHLASHFYAKLNFYYCTIFNYKQPALYRAFNKNLIPVISTNTLASFIRMPDCSLCAKATPP